MQTTAAVLAGELKRKVQELRQAIQPKLKSLPEIRERLNRIDYSLPIHEQAFAVLDLCVELGANLPKAEGAK